MSEVLGVLDTPFPPETLSALFEAVDTDDIIDPVVSLPEAITLDCSQQDIERCYFLTLQFWFDGVRREDVVRLLVALARTGDLGPEDRRAYKLIRARYKHLRFALVLYGETHSVPFFFGAMVALMGTLQDAYKNGHRASSKGYAVLLRLLSAKPMWRHIEREVSSIKLDTVQGFVAHRQADMQRLKTALEKEALTGKEFHSLRKVVSRQVSYHDTKRSIEHTAHDYQISRYLSAINGIMGGQHDDMVGDDLAGIKDYRTPFPLDADLRHRLEKLVEKLPKGAVQV